MPTREDNPLARTCQPHRALLLERTRWAAATAATLLDIPAMNSKRAQDAGYSQSGFLIASRVRRSLQRVQRRLGGWRALRWMVHGFLMAPA